MGSGGVGGYFGALIARAGKDITFIARGDHLAAMRAGGLRVASEAVGEFTVPVKSAGAPAEVGFADLVLFTVKMQSNAEAIPAIAPMVGPKTVILNLQNGVGNGEALGKVYGDDKIMVGPAYIQARLISPGVIQQLGKGAKVAFGEMKGGITPRARDLHKFFQECGWTVDLVENPQAVLWQKFIYLAASAGMNAATWVNYGEMAKAPMTMEMTREAIREIAAIAVASGVRFPEDPVERAMKMMAGFPQDGNSSLAKDFRAGKTVELDGLTGTVVRLGKELGVPTPVNRTIYAVLEPMAKRLGRGK